MDLYEETRRKLLAQIREMQDRHRMELEPLVQEYVRLNALRLGPFVVLADSPLLAQIDACRKEVAQWPEWMHEQRVVPGGLGRGATDL